MMPFSSVAMIEKFGLLRIAFCRAPVLRRTASCRRSAAVVAAEGGGTLSLERSWTFLGMADLGWMAPSGESPKWREKQDVVPNMLVIFDRARFYCTVTATSVLRQTPRLGLISESGLEGDIRITLCVQMENGRRSATNRRHD